MIAQAKPASVAARKASVCTKNMKAPAAKVCTRM
jgi:hypothetical protein